MAMSPSRPPKKYEQNQTGFLELLWREKMNNELFPQLLGFLVTCQKIYNEPKAIPDINLFPPFALFLSSLIYVKKPYTVSRYMDRWLKTKKLLFGFFCRILYT
jgi:hypothetical protein